ncbi:hypothetical protein ASE02_20395 [Phenylobacterium sp. Root700]|nr:hypothetical protein ASE02_20395 [Phenylobacterium sp. Root700]
MDDDHVEGRRPEHGRFDHRLERRPAIIGGGVAGFDELFGDVPVLPGAVSLKLAALVGNGEVTFGLTAG